MSDSAEEQWDDEQDTNQQQQQQQRLLDDSDASDDDQQQQQQQPIKTDNDTTTNMNNLGLYDSDDEDDDNDGGGGGAIQTHDQHHQQPSGDIDIDVGGDEEELDVLDLDVEDQNVAMNDTESLLMKFCPHDSSMLYPKEDKRNRSLRYACRLCRYSECSAGNAIIYRNILKHEVGNVLHKVPSAVADDPTLPRSQQASCENCGHDEAVFFQSATCQTTGDSLALIFVCCNCDYKWVA